MIVIFIVLLMCFSFAAAVRSSIHSREKRDFIDDILRILMGNTTTTYISTTTVTTITTTSATTAPKTTSSEHTKVASSFRTLGSPFTDGTGQSDKIPVTFTNTTIYNISHKNSTIANGNYGSTRLTMTSTNRPVHTTEDVLKGIIDKFKNDSFTNSPSTVDIDEVIKRWKNESITEGITSPVTSAVSHGTTTDELDGVIDILNNLTTTDIPSIHTSNTQAISTTLDFIDIMNRINNVTSTREITNVITTYTPVNVSTTKHTTKKATSVNTTYTYVNVSTTKPTTKKPNATSTTYTPVNVSTSKHTTKKPNATNTTYTPVNVSTTIHITKNVNPTNTTYTPVNDSTTKHTTKKVNATNRPTTYTPVNVSTTKHTTTKLNATNTTYTPVNMSTTKHTTRKINVTNTKSFSTTAITKTIEIVVTDASNATKQIRATKSIPIRSSPGFLLTSGTSFSSLSTFELPSKSGSVEPSDKVSGTRLHTEPSSNVYSTLKSSKTSYATLKTSTMAPLGTLTKINGTLYKKTSEISNRSVNYFTSSIPTNLTSSQTKTSLESSTVTDLSNKASTVIAPINSRTNVNETSIFQRSKHSVNHVLQTSYQTNLVYTTPFSRLLATPETGLREISSAKHQSKSNISKISTKSDFSHNSSRIKTSSLLHTILDYSPRMSFQTDLHTISPTRSSRHMIFREINTEYKKTFKVSRVLTTLSLSTSVGTGIVTTEIAPKSSTSSHSRSASHKSSHLNLQTNSYISIESTFHYFSSALPTELGTFHSTQWMSASKEKTESTRTFLTASPGETFTKSKHSYTAISVNLSLTPTSVVKDISGSYNPAKHNSIISTNLELSSNSANKTSKYLHKASLSKTSHQSTINPFATITTAIFKEINTEYKKTINTSRVLSTLRLSTPVGMGVVTIKIVPTSSTLLPSRLLNYTGSSHNLQTTKDTNVETTLYHFSSAFTVNFRRTFHTSQLITSKEKIESRTTFLTTSPGETLTERKNSYRTISVNLTPTHTSTVQAISGRYNPTNITLKISDNFDISSYSALNNTTKYLNTTSLSKTSSQTTVHPSSTTITAIFREINTEHRNTIGTSSSTITSRLFTSFGVTAAKGTVLPSNEVTFHSFSSSIESNSSKLTNNTHSYNNLRSTLITNIETTVYPSLLTTSMDPSMILSRQSLLTTSTNVTGSATLQTPIQNVSSTEDPNHSTQSTTSSGNFRTGKLLNRSGCIHRRAIWSVLSMLILVYSGVDVV